MLRDHCAHQQPAVASTHDRQLFRTGIILFDQILRSRRKIVEHVLFLREVTPLVPFFAELASAADVRHDINAAAIEPESPYKIKVRRHTYSVAAIAVQQRRVLPVALRSFSEKDVERNFCAVFCGGELAANFDVREGDWGRAAQRRLHRLCFLVRTIEPCRRLGVTDVAEKKSAVLQREHLLHSRDLWKWDDRFAFAIQVEAPDWRGAAEQIAHEKHVAGGY